MSPSRPYTCRDCGAAGHQKAGAGRPRTRCPTCAAAAHRRQVDANNARYAAERAKARSERERHTA